MDENLTEQQQIEQLKKLWKEYGFSIVLGGLIAIGITLGWRFYQNYQTRHAEQASLIYQHMMINLMQGEPKLVQKTVDELSNDFASTPYASIAKLAEAKLAIEQKNVEDAERALQWVISNGHGRALKEIAILRLARIYIAKKQADKALELLSSIRSKSPFKALQAEEMGDAFFVLNQMKQARLAYQQSLNLLPEQATQTRLLIELKLHDLPVIN